MADAFIIMQIGNRELDHMCKESIVPAIESCGLAAKRVDKHNQGGLLKSEIIGFIESANIIIADLTNERPNCYLEIGYAMGVDKFKNLILTAREDHNLESPNHKPGGPKIHFDLAGYDILFWDSSRLDLFREELTKRIRRRLTVIQPTTQPIQNNPWDYDWLTAQRTKATTGLRNSNYEGFMEVAFALDHPKPNIIQKQLDEAVRNSIIQTFGWPIAVYLSNRNEYRPKPRADGIAAEIALTDHTSYDYWALKRTGDFYLLQSLFEDSRGQNTIFFDTRIMRVTEVFLFCVRLYSHLGIDPATNVNIQIRHGGLKNRRLKAASTSRMMMDRDISSEDESFNEQRIPIGKIEGQLVQLVEQITSQLFMLFDYAEIDHQIHEDIINNFVDGKIA